MSLATPMPADNGLPALRPHASGTLLLPTGLFLIALGVTALIGWIGHQPLLVGLLPGFPPMVMNTALMFVACGIGLIALTRSRQLAVIAIGVGVGILALLILSEHWLDWDPGIDLAGMHTWAQDGFPHPGRPAQATALCFALAAIALILRGAPPHRATLPLARLLGALVLLIGAGAGLGHLLGLDALYPSYALRGMSIPTAVGCVLLGVSLYRTAARLPPDDSSGGTDLRIVSIGTLLLVVVAMVTGLPIFFVVKAHIEDTIAAGLRTGLTTEVQLIDTIVSLRMQRAAIVINRPSIIGGLQVLNGSPTDSAALTRLQVTVESFRPHGFSALRVALPDGHVVAGSGAFLSDPAVVMRLDSDRDQQLLWRDGYYLRSRFDIHDGSLILGTVDTEQSLPQMAAAIASGHGLGDSGELQLCKRLDVVVRCFPSRRNAQPFEIPYSLGGDARLAVRAAAGGTGMNHGRDEHGNQVIGVFAPVANHGLFAVLKMDTAELYGSLRHDLERALALAVLMVFCGSLLFRALVKPMAAELVRAREISQGKSRAMERLHAFQRAVFEQAPDGILVADHEGRIVEANERMATLFGYTREGLTGKTIEELVPQRVRGEHHRHRAAFEKAPSTRVMSRDRTLQGQRADGSEFPIEVALAPMNTAEGSRVIAIVKDVSEARKAELAIREALKEKDLLLGEINDKSRAMERLHAFQRAVFEQAPDGILVADHEGRIVEANERMATLFGYTRETLTGKSIEDLVPQRVRGEHHRHRAAFEKAPSTRVMSRDRTLQGQRADGTEFPIEVALAPMSTAEGSRVIAIVKDVSEARKAEQAIRDALKEKDLLLGEIHHRVKNNLQIVHSLLDMQANLTADARAASALRDSQNRIQSMALIHQTLYQSHDFARVEFGRFLDTLMSHLQASYGRRDLSLTSRSETVRIAIDRAIPCGLIVNELVTNALKHAFPENRSGSIVVEMRLLNDVDVEVAVSDDGVGIPAALDFESLSSLGMQLVQVLTEQLHAELNIHRRNPTRVSFTFPLN
ncbi:MAG: sensor histidine kinase [Panacagrimonas sp.]